MYGDVRCNNNGAAFVVRGEKLGQLKSLDCSLLMIVREEVVRLCDQSVLILCDQIYVVRSQYHGVHNVLMSNVFHSMALVQVFVNLKGIKK